MSLTTTPVPVTDAFLGTLRLTLVGSGPIEGLPADHPSQPANRQAGRQHELRVTVDARASLQGLLDLIVGADYLWPTGVSGAQRAHIALNWLNAEYNPETAPLNQVFPFLAASPDEANSDMFVSQLPTEGGEWAVIDKETGQVYNVLPHQCQAFCDTWEGCEESFSQEVVIAVITPLPEGYEIREMKVGDGPEMGFYWVTEDTGIPPEALYPTMLEAIAASWVDIEPELAERRTAVQP